MGGALFSYCSILPSLVVVYYFAVAAHIFDEIHTVRIWTFSHGHGQHLAILEFGGIPGHFVIHVYDFDVRKTGTE
jgi:hypothetical protein